MIGIMKTIDKDELYGHLSEFLKSKGIELQDGSYTQRVRKGCAMLADVVNTTHQTVGKAKAEVGRKLSRLRQSIHEATAPKSPPPMPPQEPTGPAKSPESAPRAARSAKPSSPGAKAKSQQRRAPAAKSGKGRA